MFEILKARSADKREFEVLGYKRSDGAVVNYRLRFIGKDGYRKLVEESLEHLNRLIAEKEEKVPEAYAAALDSVKLELEKKLVPDEGKAAKLTGEDLRQLAENVCTLGEGSDKCVVFRLEILQTSTLTAAEKTSKSRDEISEQKKRIRASLPVSRYCHRLNLYPGNYDTVQ